MSVYIRFEYVDPQTARTAWIVLHNPTVREKPNLSTEDAVLVRAGGSDLEFTAAPGYTLAAFEVAIHQALQSASCNNPDVKTVKKSVGKLGSAT